MSLITMTFMAFSAYGQLSPPQEVSPPPAAIIEEMMRCSSIEASDMRLACLDSALLALKSAHQNGEVILIDRDSIAEEARRKFGFRSSVTATSGVTGAVESVENLTSTLVDTHQNSSGKWVFILEDGTSWRQTDSQHFRPPSQKNTPVTIRLAAMNSFLMRIGSGRSVRVERTR